MSVDVSGASSLKGKIDLSNTLEIDASGASNAKLIAHGRIKADLSGASSFRYGGDADKVNIHSTGASSSKRL